MQLFLPAKLTEAPMLTEQIVIQSNSAVVVAVNVACEIVLSMFEFV